MLDACGVRYVFANLSSPNDLLSSIYFLGWDSTDMGWGGVELGSGKRGVVGEGVLGLDCVKGEFGDFCFRDSNLLGGIGFCDKGSFDLGIWVLLEGWGLRVAFG